MKIILLGAPGAGKGTQAEVICERLSIPAISTGTIIREALKSGTEMGRKAKSYMEAGQLVPDEIVIGIIEERLAKGDCENGFILDGFPRTIVQAEALDRMGFAIDKVIDIEVTDEDIVARISGRRVCDKCGAIYHVQHKPSKVDGVCDKCAGTLSQRQDDQTETVIKRLKVYHDQTEPLKEYYQKQGKLLIVEGGESIADTTRKILSLLEEAQS